MEDSFVSQEGEVPVIAIDSNRNQGQRTDTHRPNVGHNQNQGHTSSGTEASGSGQTVQFDSYCSENFEGNSFETDGDVGFKESTLGFDFMFLIRFFRIHRLLFYSFMSISSLLFGFLIALSLLGEYVTFQAGNVPSRFYKVLGDKDLPAFWNATFISLAIIVAAAIVKSTVLFIQKLLTAAWRQILCQALHQRYFQDINYYQLNVLDNLIDNPDQRMTQDVDKLTSTYCEILPKLLMAPFVIAYYSYKAFEAVGWEGPVACFVFFFVGTVINKILMGPVVRYVIKQERCEGDFRFFHMLIRVNSESIAFNRAAQLEASNTNASLDKLIKIQHSLYLRQYFLNTSMNLFDYLASIVSYLVIAMPIFAGIHDDLSPSDLSSLISKNSFVNMYLIYQFTQLMDLSGKFSDIVGVTHRIAQLLERLQLLCDIRRDISKNDSDGSDEYGNYNFKNVASVRGGDRAKLIPAWNLYNVTFSLPDRIEPLIRDLNLTIFAGESLLVIGNSSVGKSSFLRILRGLWLPNAGRVERLYPPGPDIILYCPQKTYLTCGSLREQICFPLKPASKYHSKEEDNVLFSYMKSLQLQQLLLRVGGFDVPVPWNVYERFSPGEMQRLCLLRVLYHKPIIAVLDEATSAITEEMEYFIYQEFRRLNITTLSVGHRKSLRKYHDKILKFDVFGEWTLTALEKKPNEIEGESS